MGRLKTALRVVLVALLGCGVAGHGNAQAKPPQSGSGWVQDASRIALPSSPLRGRFDGKQLTMGQTTLLPVMELPFSAAPLEVMRLEFKGMAGKKKVVFRVTLARRRGERFTGREFKHRLTDPIVAPEEAKAGKPVLMAVEVDAGNDGVLSTPYTLRLKFGARKDELQAGVVNLCLMDDPRSYVAGTFTAQRK